MLDSTITAYGSAASRAFEISGVSSVTVLRSVITGSLSGETEERTRTVNAISLPARQ